MPREDSVTNRLWNRVHFAQAKPIRYNRPMNITFVAPFGLAPKGTTRWRALPLARALAARGHAVRVLVPSWDRPQDAGRVWREGSASVACVGFPAPLGRFAWPLLFARLRREVRHRASDVVHIFKPIGFSGAVAQAMLHLQQTKRPLVWADADDLEAEWARPRPAWQRAAIAHQERWILARADGVTVASRALEQHVAGWRCAPPVYLPNTSDLRPVDAAEIPGRVVWYTRFLDIAPETAADIWAAIVGAGLRPGADLTRAPTASPTLHVIGAGLRGEERAFVPAVQARGLADTVTMRGWLEGEALLAALGGACVAILPFADTPRNRYKCPARLADLTALGVPVVVHGVGECAAYVAHGETGILVTPGDTQAFADAVVGLLGDSGRRQQMRDATRMHFAAHFAPAVLAARLEQAYSAALAAQPSPGHREHSA